MARWSYLIVAVYVLLAVGYAQDAISTETTTTPVVPETTTPTTTTTTTPTTTTKPTTTTTTATTSKSTTTTAPTTTTSTTPATTKASTTTAKPEPQPDFPRNVGRWLVNGTGKSENVTCLALSAALEVTAVYKDDKNASQTVHEIIPTTATSSGTCADNDVSVTIIGGNVTLKLTFSRNETSQQSALSEIDVNVTLPNNASVAVKLENQALFEAPLNKSYKCTKETSVKLPDEVNLRVASLQVEAFRQTAFDNYSAALECAIDDVSPVVPLAVGISLAVLVVIVLIAYLIGRSRSRARGYQSV